MHLKLLIIFSVFICGSYNLSAQPRKGISFAGNNLTKGKNIFVGEIHTLSELAEFKVDLIEHLYQRYDITDIFTEYGRSRAYLSNYYLETGDTTVFSYSHPRYIEWMKKLKTVNDAQPPSGKFKIHGIDFERVEWIRVVKMLLDKHPQASATKLSAYINSIPLSDYIGEYSSFKDTEPGKYNKARRIFNEEKEVLKALLQDDFAVAESVLFNSASRDHFKRRNLDMYTNLSSSGISKRNFICFIGGSHTELHNSNSFFSYYLADTSRSNNALLIDMACDCGSIRKRVTGPKVLSDNEPAFSNAFNNYYKPGEFIMVEQSTLKELSNSQLPIPTYYVFFKDLIFMH